MTDTTNVIYELQVLDPTRKWQVILTSDDKATLQVALMGMLDRADSGEYNERLRIVEVVTTVRSTIVENVRSPGR